MHRNLRIPAAIGIFSLLLCLAPPQAAAQPDYFYYHAIFHSYGLFTSGCNGSGPLLSSDTPVWVIWDRNHNGPDSMDYPACWFVQGLACVPEDAICNLYMFYMDTLGGFTSPVFAASRGSWAGSQFYLCIFAGDSGELSYTTSDFAAHLVTDTAEVEIPIGDWTCAPTVVPVPQCMPSMAFHEFVHGNPPREVCFETCAGNYTDIAVLPPHEDFNPYRPPVLKVTGGCSDSCSRAGAFAFNPAEVQLMDFITSWWYKVWGMGRGCTTVQLLDSVPSAHVDTFWIAQQNNRMLRWHTRHEYSVSNYSVWRADEDGYRLMLIGSTPAWHQDSADYVLQDSAPADTIAWFYTLIANDSDGTPYAVRYLPNIRLEAEPSPFIPQPSSLSLSSFPNPFNSRTEIRFDLPRAMQVKLDVHNLLGQSVTTLVNARMESGSHRVDFDASSLPSGLYIYRLDTPNGSLSRKMLLLK